VFGGVADFNDVVSQVSVFDEWTYAELFTTIFKSAIRV